MEDKDLTWTAKDDKWADQMVQHMVDNLNKNVSGGTPDVPVETKST